MKSVEAEAGSIDDAIEKALRELGVGRERADIEIVSNATRGLFGFGGRKAAVRATLRAPIDLHAADAAGSPPTKVQGQETPTPAKPQQIRAAARAQGSSGRPPAPAAPRPQRPAPSAAADMDSNADEEEGGAPLDASSIERARAVLAETVRLMETAATVRIAEGPEGPELSIDGDDSGLLIGRRGQTLDALEYIANRVASRDAGQTARLVVDSQGYRVRRRESLQDLARRLAERARKRRAVVPMNPMSPRDRRIVHLALQDDATVETRSSGKGHFRKLLIVPRGAHPPKK